MRHPRLPEPFTFFVDECLGRHVVPEAIRGAVDKGEKVIALRERFPDGALDEEWLTIAGIERWLVFTQDKALRYVPNELAALRRSNTAVFMVGQAKGEVTAALLAGSLATVRRVVRANDVPLIANVEPSGTVLLRYVAGEHLTPSRRIKPKRGA